LAVLGKRLEKFGLALHPDKTQLIDFRPPAERSGVETTLPTTFAFLGFLHAWGKTRRGQVTMWQRTAKDRLARTLKAFNRRCRLIAALAVSRATSSPMPDAARALCLFRHQR
jgi:hypothetical protein